MRFVRLVVVIFAIGACSSGGAAPRSPSPTPAASVAAPTASASTSSVGPPGPDVVVTRTALKSFSAAEGLMYELIVEVQNRGTGHARIDQLENSYTIFDTSGQVLMGGPFVYVFPQVIGPGEYGYFVDGDSTYPSGTTIEQIGSVEPSITSSNAPGPAAAYAVSGVQISADAGLEVRGAVTNPTPNDASDGIVGVILFGSTGEILGAVYDNVSIATIKAGQARGFDAIYPPTPPITPSDVSSWKAFAFDIADFGVVGEVAAARTLGEVAVGECFNEVISPTDDRIHGADVVPCDGPHQLEMYGHETLPDPPGTPYPGDPAMHQAGDATCRALFRDYVGSPYDTSEYWFWYYTPDAEDWFFQRRVDCALGNADRSMQPPGSARGSGR